MPTHKIDFPQIKTKTDVCAVVAVRWNREVSAIKGAESFSQSILRCCGLRGRAIPALNSNNFEWSSSNWSWNNVSLVENTEWGNPKFLFILSQWSCGLLITRCCFHAQKTEGQMKYGEGLILLDQEIVSCCLLYENVRNKKIQYFFVHTLHIE